MNADRHQISSENLAKLERYLVDEFIWDHCGALKHLVRNIKVLGRENVLKFFSSEIFPHVSLPFARKLFEKTVQNSTHLNSVKIRWRNKKGKLKK